MHELGKHLKATLVHDGMETPLHDEDFDWSSQTFTPLPNVKAHKGDIINLRCDWNNTTMKTVGWGGSASQEMCSAFVYRYPAGDGNYCTE